VNEAVTNRSSERGGGFSFSDIVNNPMRHVRGEQNLAWTYKMTAPFIVKGGAGFGKTIVAKFRCIEKCAKAKLVCAAGVNDVLDGSAKKWRGLSKWKKVSVIAGSCGAVIIALPFAVSAIGGMTIVQALCWLGFGALGVGGFGVAGGIIVTAGGATLGATIGATIASKFVSDPELIAVKEALVAVEGMLKDRFEKYQKAVKARMKERSANERIRSVLEQSQSAWKHYATAAKNLADINTQISKGKNYSRDAVLFSKYELSVAKQELEQFYEGIQREGLA